MNNLGKIKFMDDAAAAAPEAAPDAQMDQQLMDCLMQTKDALSQGDVDSAMQLLDQCIQIAQGDMAVSQPGAEAAPSAGEEPAY